MARFTAVRNVKLDQLVVSQQQARTRDVEKDLGDLVDNIRVHGQLEPIIVAPLNEAGKLEIIAGQRRWLAMQRLGFEEILAAILDEQVDEATARVLSISENLVRQDLTSKDLIDACTALHRKYGSIKAVADELGLPYNKVRSYVKFERLRPQLKALVETGEIDIKTAVRVEDHLGEADVPDEQLAGLVRTVSGMTSAQQVDYFNGTGKASVPTPRASEGAPPQPANGSARPGSVRQIIVTLRQEDHTKLREWAAGKGLGQDKAAAWIINAFLKQASAAKPSGSSGSSRPSRHSG
jgi:ParB family transcriptional regulator, chromosome partitioning protein